MKVVILDEKGEFECHKAECRDAVKKLNQFGGWSISVNHWYEESLEQAEISFNEDLGVDSGYEPPWVWKQHVRVYDCAKKG